MDVAAVRRDTGMDAATGHADHKRPGWSGDALDALRTYALTHEFFLSEDYIAEALAKGLDPPPDRRAFGAVVSGAARLGIISREGYALARTSNLSPKPLWRSEIFEE